MIKLRILLSEIYSIIEGTAVPGALEGWLDTNGTCHYVSDTHTEWSARYFKVAPPDEKDIGAYEAASIRLKKALYNKGWARIVVKHDINLIYFDTFDTDWTSLTKAQRGWLKNSAIHGMTVKNNKIVPNDINTFREHPYRIEFGNKGGKFISPEDI